MTRLDVGEALAARLYATEAAIDQALASAASLAAALPAARVDAWLSATAGQRAFTGAAATISALADARAHIVQTHHTLAALARRLGLDDLAVGPLDKPGDGEPIGGGGGDGPALRPGTVNKILPIAAKSC